MKMQEQFSSKKKKLQEQLPQFKNTFHFGKRENSKPPFEFFVLLVVADTAQFPSYPCHPY